MSDSSAEFSGAIPHLYDTHLGPVLFEPYAADLVSRLPPGQGLRLLEIACGTGIVTRRLREALPDSATVVATDLNQGMIDHARQTVTAPGIEWRTADAQSLPFGDASFDVVVCQFGFMFLPNKVLGFQEARRVLAPGGLLLTNVWGSLAENPYALAMHERLARRFPDDPPTFLETPYGYRITSLLEDMEEAGWERVEVTDRAIQSASVSARSFATGFALGSPLTHDLVARGADPEDIAEELEQTFVLLGGSEPFLAELSASVISAVR